MPELDVSVVIPTCNMASHLPTLWRSLVSAGVAERVREVLFVDDGSTDDTPRVLAELAGGSALARAKLRVLALPENVNRFKARLLGAKRAASERLLFLDSRVELPSGFAAGLEAGAQAHRSACGVVELDTERSVYCLYWDRSHRVLFRRTYRDLARGIVLTPENFHRYVKGTSVFLCERELFVRTCEAFEGRQVLSDDNRILEEMVAHTPIAIEPRMRVLWTPRETAKAFLGRLWERGPSFVEYHVFGRRAPWFWFYLAGLGAVAAWLACALVAPSLGLWLLGGGLAVLTASTAIFARGPRELVQLAPLHVATVLVFGLGLLNGTVVNLLRVYRREFPKLEKPV